MLKFPKSLKYSAGVTLVELAAAMVIASVAAVGLGTGITTIVGFYQDDWVTRDVRYWGYECMDYIFKQAERSKRVRILTNVADYDVLVMAPAKPGPEINIQANEYDGLLVNGNPMLDYMDFPAEGEYRTDGQRIVALESFHARKVKDDDEFKLRFEFPTYLNKLLSTLYIIEMNVSVTTKYQGEQEVEYIKFRRLVWLKSRYF